jgi:hypothetical protein
MEDRRIGWASSLLFSGVISPAPWLHRMAADQKSRCGRNNFLIGIVIRRTPILAFQIGLRDAVVGAGSIRRIAIVPNAAEHARRFRSEDPMARPSALLLISATASRPTPHR